MEIHVTFGMLLLAPLILQSGTTDPDGRLEGNNTYIGLPGKKLTLIWTYTGTEPYQRVSIFIPQINPQTGKTTSVPKLWDLIYFAENRTFSIHKYNIHYSIFNNLTEFSKIKSRSVFVLVLKSVPRNVSSFEFLCRLEKEEKWEIPKEKKVTVHVAVTPTVKIPIKKEEEIDVPKGRDVSLRCQVTSGFPQPKIEWRKEEKILPSKLIDPHIAVLELRKVQPVNAGRYVCTAKNIAGRHNDDVIITVKYIELKTGYTSIFKSSLGSFVDLSCPIEGYPQVTYSWFKGNYQLGQRSGYTVRIATNADFDNYTCIGENGFGSKKATFTIIGDPSKSQRNLRGKANTNRSNSLLILLPIVILALYIK